MTSAGEIRHRAFQALKPPPRIDLPTWLESELRLPAGVSPTPGKIVLTPFQRGIAAAIGSGQHTRVTVVKSIRQGYSTLLVGTLAHLAANDPSPVIFLAPIEQDCRNFVTRVLEPVAAVTPALGKIFQDSERSTMLSKIYPGGSLLVTPSRSPGNLRAHNARVLLVDESSAMQVTIEGDPITIAEKRTFGYGDRLIIVGSTPVTEHDTVLKLYEQSDKRIFEVQCVECSDYAEILFKDLKFDPANIAAGVEWCCPNCGSLVPERRKADMVNAGRWRPLKPEVTDHAGFKANAFISLLENANWTALCAEFLESKDDPDRLRVWINTILAEPFREAGSTLDQDALRSRAERFDLDNIPESVRILTCGIDIQDSWCDWTIAGWSDRETFILGNGQIHGRYDSPDFWSEIDDLLRRSWKHPLSGNIRLDSAFLDEGDGDHQPHVRAFTRPRWNRRIAASKGMAGFSRPPIDRSSVKGVVMYIIGTEALKNRLFNLLQGGNTVRFSDTLSERYYDELVSEVRQIRYKAGVPTRSFVRIPGKRAEALDSTVLAMACRHLVNVDLERRAAELSSPAAPVSKTPSIIRSAWLSR